MNLYLQYFHSMFVIASLHLDLHLVTCQMLLPEATYKLLLHTHNKQLSIHDLAQGRSQEEQATEPLTLHFLGYRGSTAAPLFYTVKQEEI